MTWVRSFALLLVVAFLASACSVHRLEEGQVDAIGDELTGPNLEGPQGTSGPGGPGATNGPGVGPGGSGDPAATARPPTQNVASGEVRRASETGVTKDQILLGILQTSDDTATAIGGGSSEPVNNVIKPFIDDVNEHGGINGRKLVYKITEYDPLTQDNMQAACVEQAEDVKPFAAMAQGGFFGDAEVCMATKKVPLLTGNGSSVDTMYRREKGWVRSTAQNKDRNAKIWVDWMLGRGLLTKTKKVGLLYTDVPEDRQLVRNVVIPYLASKGVKNYETFAYSSSIAQTPNETASAILKFRGEGVQLVLPFVSFLRMLIFLNQAEAARYKPQYSASDFGVMASDATATFPASQWANTEGITTLNTGIDPPGAEPKAKGYQECKAVYAKHGQKVEPDDPFELINFLHYCQHIALFADAARRAGVNPTRESYLAALGNTGTWNTRVVLSQRLTYTPKKYDGPDLYSVVRWKADCYPDGGGCYRQIRGYQLGKW